MASRAGPQVPIHHRSPRFQELEAGPFRVTSVEFEARSRIEPHSHDRPNLGVMLEGSFDLAFGSRSFACEPGTLFLEPAGETHGNRMGCRGAWVLALQPDPATDLEGAVPLIFGAPAGRRHPLARYLAHRIVREVEQRDDFSPLAIQSLGFELLALAGRAPGRPAGEPPAWLGRIEDLLCDSGPTRLTLADLAGEAGVHPAHLAREFRRRYGRSLGRFLLERRLEWAARQLAGSDRPISRISLEAGFADQSHFTRRFRSYAGETPRRYRASRRA
jgi:AraC family transcriptional regulator